MSEVAQPSALEADSIRYSSEPTFLIWLKSSLGNASLLFQLLSNYEPIPVFTAIFTPYHVTLQ